MNLIHLVLLVSFVELARCHDSWTLTRNTDADTCNKGLENKVNALESQVKQLQKLIDQSDVSTYSTIDGFPRDCFEIYQNGTRTDGLYSISPDGRCPFLVFCDMTNGGWTVIQKRVDGKVNFYRSWVDYVTGFGDTAGSYWLGLEKIHRLTTEGSQIYFDMENYDGTKDYAHYQVFTVHEAATAYKMNVDAYNYNGSLPELLSYHDNMKFSTYDRDNDAHSSNCCKSLNGGGWWYKNCYKLGNLNGVFGQRQAGGIGYWNGHAITIKNVTIKVKSINGMC